MLYLLVHGPIGIQAMHDDEVASQGGLSRALRDLIVNGYVELDTSRTVPGRPYKLTRLGRQIAAKLAEAEALVPPPRAPPASP